MDPIEKACTDYWSGLISGGELMLILSAKMVPQPIIDLLGKMHGEMVDSNTHSS